MCSFWWWAWKIKVYIQPIQNSSQKFSLSHWEWAFQAHYRGYKNIALTQNFYFFILLGHIIAFYSLEVSKSIFLMQLQKTNFLSLKAVLAVEHNKETLHFEQYPYFACRFEKFWAQILTVPNYHDNHF